MAQPGPPDAAAADGVDLLTDGGPAPRDRPIGADEPSAPVDVPPGRPRPGPGPDVPPGDPQGPDLRDGG